MPGGRPARSDTRARARQGVSMTDAEWAPVEKLQARDGLRAAEAVRRLIAAGAQVLGVGVMDDSNG